jgi:probable addiction module antidote protein
MTKFAPFDAADYLTDEETIAEYLSAALEDPDPDLFLVAVRDVARALVDVVHCSRATMNVRPRLSVLGAAVGAIAHRS